jgi:hypothetical protein
MFASLATQIKDLVDFFKYLNLNVDTFKEGEYNFACHLEILYVSFKLQHAKADHCNIYDLRLGFAVANQSNKQRPLQHKLSCRYARWMDALHTKQLKYSSSNLPFKRAPDRDRFPSRPEIKTASFYTLGLRRSKTRTSPPTSPLHTSIPYLESSSLWSPPAPPWPRRWA